MHYVTFCHQGWACLFVFGNYNLLFHTKSEMNKLLAEGSAHVPISLNKRTEELSVNK